MDLAERPRLLCSQLRFDWTSQSGASDEYGVLVQPVMLSSFGVQLGGVRGMMMTERHRHLDHVPSHHAQQG